MTETIPHVPKYAADDLIYAVFFGRFDYLATDLIATAAVSVSPSGMTATVLSVSSDGLTANVEISGGTAGVTYTLTVTPTRVSGKTGPAKAFYFDIVSP